MALEKLMPGDTCVLTKKSPSFGNPDRVVRYRYLVVDALSFPKRRGQPRLVPCFRPINRKKNACNIDRPDDRVKQPKIKWIERSKLRKISV